MVFLGFNQRSFSDKVEVTTAGEDIVARESGDRENRQLRPVFCYKMKEGNGQQLIRELSFADFIIIIEYEKYEQ